MRLFPVMLITMAIATAVCTAAEDEARDASVIFDSVYGSRVTAVNATPEVADDLVLAADLLGAARASSDNLPLLVVLTDRAYELAAQDLSGYDTALDALGLRGAFFPDLRPEFARKALVLAQQRYQSAGPNERRRMGERLVDVLIATAHTNVEHHHFAQAIDYLERAQTIARTINSERTDQILRAHANVVAAKRETDRIAELQARSDGGDRSAATRLLRYYLVEADDPQRAAALADRADDAELAQLAAIASRPVASLSDDQALRLADWYRNTAILTANAAKAKLLQRAYLNYRRFIEAHPQEDLARKSAELSLADTEKALHSAGAAIPGQSIDLLALIDPQKHTGRGWAERGPAGIVLTKPGEICSVFAPVRPSGSYEVTVRYSRQGLEPFVVLLPMGDRRPYVRISAFGGTYSGFGLINGMNERNNPTKTPSKLPPGGTYELRVVTKHDGTNTTLTAFVNDQRHLHWSGKRSALSDDPYWTVKKMPGVIGFCTQAGPLTIHSAQLRMLDGTVEILQPVDAPVLVQQQTHSQAPAEIIEDPSRLIPEATDPKRPSFFGVPIE